MDLVEISITAVGAFISICMFTTLYGKSNPLYALAEESYIGFATGLTVVVNLLYIYRTGILGIQAGDTILIVGIILGIMILTRISKKYSYIARLPLAITIGAQFGLALRTTIFSGFIDQIKGTILPLFNTDMQSMIYNWTIAISVILMLTFFLYTMELKGPLGLGASIGEYIMYICFGAIFAQTFMGRLGLFVGFMQNYTVPPWKIPYLLGSLIIVFGAVMILDKLKLLEKLTPEE
ncbi:hypothetical protein KEJ47_09665 [Candidatus Bathyarchaeota archaeon]|nr:hypothetical protein [Candidatus Bathyarchaeota archaeon]